tara:strand:+ start:801 stop:1736 length:936 start_codon:yes stop_codon:yes gene_type:complete
MLTMSVKYQHTDFKKREKEEKENKKLEKKKDKSKISETKEEEDLTIYPVRVEEDKNNQGDPKKYYPLSSEVHLHLIIGRVKAGKSTLLNSLYMSRRFYADAFKVRILISSTAVNDAVNKYLLEDFDYVFTEYTPQLLETIIEMVEQDEEKGRYLIILDDIIGSVNFKRQGKVDEISSLVSKYRHIGNEVQEGKLSLCLTTQYWKYFPGILRNNATAYYLLGAFPETELKKMAEDLSFFGGGNKEFIQIFNETRDEEFDFTYLSVQHLEARRNHTDLIWSKKDGFVKKPTTTGLIEENKTLDTDKEENELQS